MINLKIGNIEISGYAALAPMAGVADRATRELCKKYGAAYTVGELASSKGISLGSKKSVTYLDVNDSERPFASQIFGCEPEIMVKAAKAAESYGPDFLDINMGCPAPKVAISSGGGSALLKDPILAGKIVESVVNAVNIPVTVKIRSGWDFNSINAVEIAKICESSGASAITIHGRTRSQMYAPPVDYEIIKNVKQSVNIPVIANGDITSPLLAAKMYEETGCDFIMIGRGAMGKPWLFSMINNYLYDGTIIPEPSLIERMLIMQQHIEKIVEYKGEKIGMREARKHTAWYMRGLKGAAELRRKCGELNELCDLKYLIELTLKLNKDK